MNPRTQRLTNILIGGGGLAIIALMIHWGGIPEMSVGFALGVLVLVGSVIVLAWLVWHLLLSPLPANYRVQVNHGSVRQRWLLGVLVLIAGLLFVVGAFWDEVWHRAYGIPFGEDFFWRPHIMMYISLGLTSLFALGGLYLIVFTQGKGTLRQRFRAQPLIGLLALVAGFQIITTPLDPVWHMLYGADISAWSLPHLILVIGTTATMLAAAALLRSVNAASQWRGLLSIRPAEILLVSALSLVMIIAFQLLTAEWEGLRVIGVAHFQRSPFWQRPEWLYPVMILSIAAWLGSFLLGITRRIGTATLAGVIALAFRFGMLTVFEVDFSEMGIVPYATALPPLVMLDLWYGLQVRRTGHAPGPVSSGLVALLGLVVGGLPVIAQGLIYPRINADILPGVLVAGAVMAAFCVLAGSKLAASIEQLYPAAQPTEEAATGHIIWVPAGALAGTIAFIMLFIGTATPPI